MEFHEDKVKLIAEIGGNHEGDFSYAKELLNLAAEANVDVIKFQIYSGATLVNKDVDFERKRHFDKFTFTNEQYIELADRCRSLGIDFNASIWNKEQIDFFDDYLSFYKIGSGDLTAFPIIEHLAIKGKPIILSTGLSNEYEIKESIEFICNTNPIYKKENMLCIMQCTSSYPTPDDELNLNVIRRFKEIYNYQVGFSNHSTNPYALDYSISLGARVLEFHFTDSRDNKEFRDHKVSLTKKDVLSLQERIPFIMDSLGSKTKEATESEIQSDHIVSFRRGTFPKREIKKGDIVNINDFVFLRPAKGISAKDGIYLEGKVAKRDLSPLEILSPEDFHD
ncbi:MAG: N-acetylneuraminate synthase [Flavobacteriales bacterium]|nr:N-acetylneuraminate synthase [Flavobacteriales bacterium]